FFQAEDGIRDRNVTGVQTCALPILSGCQARPSPAAVGRARTPSCVDTRPGTSCQGWPRPTRTRATTPSRTRVTTWSVRLPPARRSEERRVGKECGDWVLPDSLKNKL